LTVKPYLQLVRLPNLFTAAADPLAGFLIVGGAIVDARRWLPLMLAGVAIYAGGMILNDVFDYEVDRLERPLRPLPSRRVSRRFAAWLGGSLLLVGPALAAISGGTSLIVALLLSTCVLGYDAGLKRTVLGPEFMGACRSLNLLLGMSQAERIGGPIGWLAAGMFGLFVVGLTWISRDEVAATRSGGLRRGLGLEHIALLGMAGAVIGFGRGAVNPGAGILSGMIVLSIAAWVIISRGFRALRSPSPATLQAAVKTGVFSLIWLDVALASAARGPLVAMSIAVLWFPAYALGKWLYST
jgi:4-hydroxybenzoate polyprenyltransferase